MEMGRFHEKPVGPHPMWSYQLAFPVASFPDVVSWLALNRGTLDVLIHPNTDDVVRDHQGPLARQLACAESGRVEQLRQRTRRESRPLR